MAGCLESIGIEVMTAHNGKDALTLLSLNKFDLVLTDLLMPEMTGLELMVKVRSEHEDPPRFVIMTGYASVSEDVLKVWGAENLYHKPLELNRIAREICDKLL